MNVSKGIKRALVVASVAYWAFAIVKLYFSADSGRELMAFLALYIVAAAAVAGVWWVVKGFRDKP